MAYTTIGLAYTALVLSSSLALKRAPPNYTPEVIYFKKKSKFIFSNGMSATIHKKPGDSSSQIPPQGWSPAGGTTSPALRSVHVDVVPRTPQVPAPAINSKHFFSLYSTQLPSSGSPP